MEIIQSIEEIFDLQLGNTGCSTDKVRLGMVQMINAVFGGYAKYDGYKIKTSEHEYLILIDNGQSCCEDWGYFSSDDDFDYFVGKELISVELTDTALNKKKVEDAGADYLGYGGIQFVDFKMSDGAILQFAVYNSHNGYYGHPIIIAKDADIIWSDTL